MQATNQFSPQQLSAAMALFSPIARDGIICGNFNWFEVRRVLGVEQREWEIFGALCEAGLLRELDPLPGTFGHSRFAIVGHS